MARMIDGDVLTERLRGWLESPHGENVYNSGYDDAIWHVLDVIEHMPTLTQPNDFTPVQHGRWVKPVPGDGENYCSVCHAVQPWFYGYGYYDSDYCPNCGACMDAKEELKDGKE